MSKKYELKVWIEKNMPALAEEIAKKPVARRIANYWIVFDNFSYAIGHNYSLKIAFLDYKNKLVLDEEKLSRGAPYSYAGQILLKHEILQIMQRNADKLYGIKRMPGYIYPGIGKPEYVRIAAYEKRARDLKEKIKWENIRQSFLTGKYGPVENDYFEMEKKPVVASDEQSRSSNIERLRDFLVGAMFCLILGLIFRYFLE